MLPSLTDRNLIITGYSGRNHLALARTAAQRLRLPFIDYGQRFEVVADMTPDSVRELFGEARQRTIESGLIDEFALYRATVIHMSGSTLAQGDYYARLNPASITVCLVASIDAVLSRLHLRMGLRFHVPAERDMAIGELRREWLARTLPGVHLIDTSSINEAETITRIVDLWRKETGALDWRE